MKQLQKNLCLMLVFIAQIQVWGYDVTTSYLPCQPCMLPEALEQVSEHYAVFFSYQTKFVNDVEVSFTIEKNETFDQAIDRLLSGVGLEYKAVNNKYYMIYAKGTSKKNLNKISRKLNQLERLERKNNLKIVPKVSKNMNGFELIANASQEFYQPYKDISGRVTDSEQNPLIGVNVFVKGTTQGDITDIDGFFSLSDVEDTDTVVFSYVGYLTKEVSVPDLEKSSQIVLSENTETLDEVVVVGYGTQKRGSLTGAVSVISQDALENRPITSVATGLQGLAPGLVVTRTNGQPGNEGINIDIRGVTSANGSVSPLVVVDGINYPASILTTMNPNDIATISVLKDAAAASIYGAQAAGGVILITTKNGAEGKVKIEFSSIFSAKKPLNMPQRMTLLDEALFNNVAFLNAGASRQYSDTDLEYIQNGTEYRINPNDSNDYIYYNQTPMTELLLRDYAPTNQYNLSASGGTNQYRYYFSGSYLGEDGILKYGPNNSKRYNAKINLDATINKYLTASARLGYTKLDVYQPSLRLSGDYGIIYQIARFRLRNPLLTPEGRYAYQNNTLARLEEGGYNNNFQNRFDGVIILEAANFVDGLTLKGVFGSTYRKDDDDIFLRTVPLYNRTGIRSYLNQNNSYNVTTQTRVNNNVQLLANYNKTFNEVHDLAILGGYQFEDYSFNSFSAGVSNLISNDLPGLTLGSVESRTNSQGYTAYAYQSLFSRLSYVFDSRYVIGATYRLDESSKLAPNYRTQGFWSVSGAWNINNEKWFENALPIFSILKLRLSWGQLGGSLGFDNFSWANTLNNGSSLVLGDTRTTYFYQQSIPSSTISWENIETTNGGIDLGLFENKLLFSFDYYVKKNENMATTVPVPSVLGVNAPKKNIGKLKTHGWETEVLYRNTVGKGFSYNIGFNLSDSQNKLIEFENNIAVGPGRKGQLEGYPLNTFWGYKTDGYLTSDEEVANSPFVSSKIGVGDVKYIDLDNDGKITSGNGVVGDSGDLIYIGTDAPRFNFGLTFNADYRGFNFTLFVQGVGKRNFLPGYHILAPLSQSWRQPISVHADYWTPENQDALYPRPVYQGTWNYLASDKWILDAGYARLKNIQLGYTLPRNVTEKFNVERLQFYILGQDIWTYSRMKQFRSVFDPESQNGVVNDYPYFGTTSFGINIKF